MSLEPRDFTFDLIVIGGGIVGSGVARDAALRGLSCLLLEKDDFSSGASSKASHLVHSGISYLERGEFNLALENMHERDLLVHMAPHLLRPISITMPVYRGDPRKLWKMRLALGLYDWASLVSGAGQYDILRPTTTLQTLPFLNPDGLLGSAVFREHQLAFPERLVLENILSAREHGAFCLNYHEVLRIEETPDHLHVNVKDTLNNSTHLATARAVVNATGVWADGVSERYRSGLAPKVIPTRDTHLMVKCELDRPICASAHADNRIFFAIPLEGQVLLGLTHSPHEGDPDRVAPTQGEADLLVEEFHRLLPSWNPAPENLLWAFSGLYPRALRRASRKSLVPTYRHVLHQEGAAGRFLTIVGGAFGMYRKMAEEAVDATCRLLRHPIPSSTDRVPFFGGGFRDSILYREDLCEWSEGIPDLPREVLDHLIGLYGRRCCDVIHLGLERHEWREPIAPGYRDYKAQVIYAMRAEDAHHLSDVILRRLRMGLGPDRGLAGASGVADLMATELGWNDATKREEVEAFQTLIAEGRPFGGSGRSGDAAAG